MASINNIHTKAARDAFKKAGQLFTHKEDGVVQGDPFYARLARDVQVFDDNGMAHRKTTLRLVKADVPALTKQASFVDEGNTEFFFQETISDDGITILADVRQ